jgi:hypothetical protein
MPLRAALNVVYALQVKGMDAKERAKYDAELHGWDAQDDKANKALWAASPADARPETGGGKS